MEWVKAYRPQISDELIKVTGRNRLIAEALGARGILKPEDALAYLDPDYYQPIPPEEMPGMREAVGIIESAILHGEKIGIWGDFDVDGQTATTVLVSALELLGGDVSYHIPVRAIESHGVNITNLEKMLEDGVQVLVTCDTGITAHEPALYARKRGVKFLITDHHDLPTELPRADAIINSKLMPKGHPLSTLPGVGVAFKLVEALFNRQGRSGELNIFLDLVALGIVADVAELYKETRYLLQRGLVELKSTRRLGMKILFENAEIMGDLVTEEDIGYHIAPRLNSLGRLGDANVIVDFLTSKNESQVRVIANRLEGLTAQRKLLTSQVFQAAKSQLDRNPVLLKSSALFLAGDKWSAGVIGIVANRLTERYQKPTVILSIDEDGNARGSARSIEGCDISKAIAGCGEMLESYGGHPMAAGLALKTANINQFRRCFLEEIERELEDKGFHPKLLYDSIVDLDQVSIPFVDQIEILAPFGPGNPQLVFVAQDLRLVSHSILGRSQEHLRLIVEDSQGNQQEVVWWQGAEWELPQGVFDLAFAARKNSFGGEVKLQLELLDFRVVESDEPVPKPPSTEVLDYRTVDDPAEKLHGILSKEKNVLVWSEAIEPPDSLGKTRLEVTQSDILVIWHSPPSVLNLRSVIKQVDPKTIYYFGVDPQLDEFESFITRLAGLSKFILSKKQGRIELTGLASIMAHTKAVVRMGLEWLVNSGKFSIIQEQAEEILIAKVRNQNEIHQSPEITYKQIIPLLQETRAFRKYLATCTQTQLEDLISGK